MQFTIDAKTFSKELEAVKKVVSKKSTIPVLENIRIDARGDHIEITGTDLDQTIIAVMPARVQTPGTGCINADSLAKTTKSLDGELQFTLDDKPAYINVSCGRINTRFGLIDSENFPLIPEIKPGDTATVDNARLQLMVKDVLFAVTKEQSRFSLNGAKFELNAGHIRIVSTDEHRMVYADSNSVQGALTWNKDAHVIIPSEALKVLPVLNGETVDISATGDNVRFTTGGTIRRSIITCKLTGQFPNYEMVMPKEFADTATVDVSILRDAVKRASHTANERNKSLHFNMRAGEVEIATDDGEGCVRTETVDIEYTGALGTYGFNWAYLLDYLTTVKSEKATMSLGDVNSQVQFAPVDYAYDLRYIVMPLRV